MNQKLAFLFPTILGRVEKDFGMIAWENSRTKCIGINQFERHVANRTEKRRHKRRAGLLTFSSVSDCPLACPSCERVCYTYIGFQSNRKHCSPILTSSALLQSEIERCLYQRIILIAMAFRFIMYGLDYDRVFGLFPWKSKFSVQ